MKKIHLQQYLVTLVVGLGFPLLTSAATQQTATATNLGLYGSYTWDIAVDPTDNNYLYIATYYSPNGFFRSADGGQTWHGLPETADHGAGHDVEVNPTNGHVYALLNDLLVSTDHGESYTVAKAFGASSGSLLFTQNTIVVGSDSAVWISADEGNTFDTVTVCANESIRSLASASDRIYALCYNYDTEISTVYDSLDLGAHWSAVDTTGVTGAQFVIVNPVNDSVFLIPDSTGTTTYRSDDAGSSWTALPDVPATGHLNFNSTGRIYAGWYYSDDNGDTWTQFNDRGDYNHIMMPDPTDATILYDTTTPGFWKSTDSGATWTELIDGITAVEVTSISQATDKNIVWVATQNGLAQSENFTSENPTWNYPITPTENFVSSSYDSVWVNPLDPTDVVTSTSQDLYYSTDAGVTWIEAEVDITLTGAVFQIVNDAVGTLYATVGPNTSAGAQTGGVITSSDNGATWTNLNFPDSGATHSIAVASDGDIFVGAHSTVNGVYVYRDNTWTKLSTPDEEYRAIVIDPVDANTIYALAASTGVYKSIDDGATWEQLVSGLGDIDQDLYEFNAMTLQTSTSPYTLYVSAVQNGTLAGVIYKSSDGGNTWNTLYTGKKGETFKTLLFDGLAAGNTRGIYDLKSRAKLKLRQQSNHLRLTLSDAATGKLLKHKKIKLYKKVDHQWVLVRTVHTNLHGRKLIQLSLQQPATFKATWHPTGNAAAEYTTANKIKQLHI